MIFFFFFFFFPESLWSGKSTLKIAFFFDIVWILYLSLYCTDEVLFYYYFFLYRLMKPHNSFYGFCLICSKLHTDSSMRNCPIFLFQSFGHFIVFSNFSILLDGFCVCVVFSCFLFVFLYSTFLCCLKWVRNGLLL